MSLTNFYQKTTKAFSVVISLDGSAPDITGDTVTFILKQRENTSDANATISSNANVAADGASGQANFELTPAVTDIPANKYWYSIKWTTAAAKVYILETGTVDVLDTIFD